MPNEVLIQDLAGNSLEQIRFYVSGSFSPADAGTNMSAGTPTNGLLTLSGVTNGAGRQSDKVDIGALFAPSYVVYGCVDFTGETPTGGTIDYFWLPSTSATQGNGNIAGNSGADAAAPGGALGSITLAEFKRMAQRIGSLPTHDGAVVQNGRVGKFSPDTRYGQLLVINSSGGTFEADDVEAHQILHPYVGEIQ